MVMPKAYRKMVDAFDQLPGIGQQAAERLAQHLINKNALSDFLKMLEPAVNELRRCQQCQVFCTQEYCQRCQEADKHCVQELLIVEGLAQLEQAELAGYQGLFFVLHGLLSPLAGRSPKTLGLEKLAVLLGNYEFSTITVALPETAEGRATTQFISSIAPTQSFQSISFERWIA